ncbi:MAG: sensor histidine kinase, partial [Pseudomonadota bacterium]|nr:sensor histidine kinase [Pseudomonadota bacterium]
TIRVNGHIIKGRVNIEISNPTPGSETDNRYRGNRIAQENIRQRLMLAFGGRTGLEVLRQEGVYRVSILFPEETPS